MYTKVFFKDLEENYPGNLECTTIYELNNSNEISISYNATSDQDTIVNMTNHNYWNFHGHKNSYQNITDHVVKMNLNIFVKMIKAQYPLANCLM